MNIIKLKNMKMIRLIALTFLSVIFLIACESSSTSDSIIENATLVSKEDRFPQCATGCQQFIVVEKNGEQIELQVDSSDTFNALIEGVTITVTYDSRSFLTDTITFPLLESVSENPPNLDKNKDRGAIISLCRDPDEMNEREINNCRMLLEMEIDKYRKALK